MDYVVDIEWGISEFKEHFSEEAINSLKDHPDQRALLTILKIYEDLNSKNKLQKTVIGITKYKSKTLYGKPSHTIKWEN